MKKTLFYCALIVLSVAICIYSCSKSYKNPMPPMGGATASVTIQNTAYSPDTLRIKTGTTVTWNNMDGITHTVTAYSGLFDSGNLMAGTAFHYTFNTAGTFAYHCLIHSMMKGVVIVSNSVGNGY